MNKQAVDAVYLTDSQDAENSLAILFAKHR
jgi:hypothetical protein